MSDWKVLREEGDYALVELNENQYSLIFYTAHRREKHIGSIDLDRSRSDQGKVLELLKGPLFRIIVSKPYDPDTDSDAKQLGDLCDRETALKRLWEHRQSIQHD